MAWAVKLTTIAMRHRVAHRTLGQPRVRESATNRR